MNKVILVMDKPENCEDCPLFRTAHDFNATIHYCMPYSGKELFMVKEKGISDKCQLKPLPQRRYSLECGDSDGNRWRESSEYDMGYNKCIDELLEDR